MAKEPQPLVSVPMRAFTGSCFSKVMHEPVALGTYAAYSSLLVPPSVVPKGTLRFLWGDRFSKSRGSKGEWRRAKPGFKSQLSRLPAGRTHS